jgi:hypothetical protein
MDLRDPLLAPLLIVPPQESSDAAHAALQQGYPTTSRRLSIPHTSTKRILPTTPSADHTSRVWELKPWCMPLLPPHLVLRLQLLGSLGLRFQVS